MSKKHLSLALLMLFEVAIGLEAHAAAESYVPEVYSPERYQQVWSYKPFSPAIPVATVPQVGGIEEQYALTGLLKMDNEWIAFVLDRKSLQRHSVSSTSNKADLQLISVEEGTDPKASTIVLRSGHQTGVVRFDLAVVLKAAPEARTIRAVPTQ